MESLLNLVRKQLPVIGTICLTVLLPIVVIYVVVAFQPFVPFSVLVRDANITAYDPANGVMFYRGALSNIGILLWWAAATVYAFTAFLLHNNRPDFALRKTFLVYMAVFTGLLALDDLFMFHEEVLPVRLGIPELVMYAVYGMLAAGLVGFVRVLLGTDFLVLGLAFGFFAFSILTDQEILHVLLNLPDGAFLLAEDLAKMLGIVCWLIFSLRTSAKLLVKQA